MSPRDGPRQYRARRDDDSAPRRGTRSHRGRGGYGGWGGRGGDGLAREAEPSAEPTSHGDERERSLSPFSKRVAMTKAMGR